MMTLTRWIGSAALLVCLAGGALADTYYSVRLSELRLVEGAWPGPEAGWSDWQDHRNIHAYARLDGGGEVYVVADREGGPSVPLTGRLFARVAGDGANAEVRGRLYVPLRSSGITRLEFVLDSDASTDSARSEFLNAKERTYRDLLALDVPGESWFRHQTLEVRRDQGRETTVGPDATRPRRPQTAELEDTLFLFTGSTAIRENIQLDRLFPPLGKEDELVDVDSVDGITVAEIDWVPRLEGKTPAKDPLAAWIPADQHAVFFPTFTAMVQVLDESDARGTPILHLMETQTRDARTQDRYSRQLCLEVNTLSRLLGPKVIASVALTGSDPYLREGTDVAILFEAKEPKTLLGYLAARHALSLQAYDGAKAIEGEVSAVAYKGVVTPDRTVSSYVAEIEGRVVVSNSLVQIRNIAEAQRGTRPNLASLPEYAFFRDRYPKGDAEESALLILTDATIRRWCSARWRIGSSRRVRAAAILGELQSDSADSIAKGSVEPGTLHATYRLAEGDALRLASRGVVSSTYGSLGFLTPIAELDLGKVTKAEVEAYRRWRDGYQRNWRRYFDPIAVRLTVQADRIAGDVTVMPLIAATEYDELIEVTRGVTLDAAAGDRHRESLLHFIMAVNPESSLARELNGFASRMVPGSKGNPLSWVGNTVEIYLDADPIWKEMAEAEDTEGFLWDNFHRVPLAVRIGIKNPLTAAVFLTTLRGYMDQTAPGLTRWESLTHREQPYVKITPAAQAIGREFAIYYAVTPQALTVTLHEGLLQRALDRQTDAATPGEAPADAAPWVGAPWVGASVALQGNQMAARIVEAGSREEYLRQLRIRSWGAIPILNEWKVRFPDQNPIAVHERLWAERLVCPGGGSYVWNAEWETVESTVFGHPGKPKDVASLPWPLEPFRFGNFGMTFEDDGLRAHAILEREP